MRLLPLILATGCAAKAASAPENVSPPAEAAIEPVADAEPEPAPAPEPEPVSAPDPEPEPVAAATPGGWEPQPMRKSPKLETKRGPTAFYRLDGPYDDLQKRAHARAMQLLRRDFDPADIDEPMVMDDVAESGDIASIHYGLTEWESGAWAMAFRKEDGWHLTPPIAASSKHYAAKIDGDIAAAAVTLGPDGLTATEYTIAFETGYSPGPFTIKLLCLDTPTPACTRPWIAEILSGGKGAKRGQPRLQTTTSYPGDGTIVIEETLRAKKLATDPDGYMRPHPITGTFAPFADA